MPHTLLLYTTFTARSEGDGPPQLGARLLSAQTPTQGSQTAMIRGARSQQGEPPALPPSDTTGPGMDGSEEPGPHVRGATCSPRNQTPGSPATDAGRPGPLMGNNLRPRHVSRKGADLLHTTFTAGGEGYGPPNKGPKRP